MDLIKQEKGKKVILGGFSQGAAVALHTLTTEPFPIKGLVVLSGYLPLRNEISGDLNKSIPVFMGHGLDDSVVPFVWGDKSRQILEEKGYTVDFNHYSGMGHECCGEEMNDLVSFMNKTL